ncbi:MAG: hypothetical protein K6E58_01385 [Eubacterium sp.]|nr:hypothetical protein [Eubacterium sp.]
MKQFIMIIGIAVIVTLIAMTLLSEQSKNSRLDELEKAVSGAVKQTVKASHAEGQTDITSNKEMVAHFVNVVSNNIKSDGKLSVKVMGVNYKEGLLDVKVSETFNYLNGKEKTITVRKCAIYE